MLMQDQSTFQIDQINTNAVHENRLLQDGFLGETLIETDSGWRQAQQLKSGDMVHTFDGGLRPVKRLERRFLGQTANDLEPGFLIKVPGGILNACSDAVFMPEQRILIDGFDAESDDITSSALVKAGDLCGLSGISLEKASSSTQIIRPIFDDEEIIWANTGLMCHFGASAADGTPRESDFFKHLNADEARNAFIGTTRFDAEVLQFRSA